jgi:hypothetical protein
MGNSVLDMSVSLDGFVAGPNETPDNGLGDNGARLHWCSDSVSRPSTAASPGGPAG